MPPPQRRGRAIERAPISGGGEAQAEERDITPALVYDTDDEGDDDTIRFELDLQANADVDVYVFDNIGQSIIVAMIKTD